MKKLLLTLLVFTFVMNQASAANYYVSSVTGSDSYSGTFAQPFANIQKASDLTNPGDTVFVMNGTYSTPSNYHDILRISRSGTAAQPIVYKNYPGHAPLIDFNVWDGISTQGASYIVIDGFTVRGNNRNITLTDATNQPSGCANTTGSPNSIYNGNGISAESNSHHITIRNNEVYECGGGGIGAGSSDYITIENNTVYNNSWYTRYGTSGISIGSSWNFDNNTTDFKIIVRNNMVYGNRLYVPWRSGTACQGITDGNGIIFDVNATAGYTGKMLAENNVCYRNGGRGIHVFKSGNVTVRNNTCFKNCASPELSEGEITAITALNVKVYNNIMYARDGERVSTVSTAANYLQDYNLLFNSPARGAYGVHDIIINPQFIDTANNDFRLAANSPAINTGSSSAGTFSNADITGITRPVGALPDMGAFEFTGVPSYSGNFTDNNLSALRVGDGVSILNTDAAAVNLIEYTTAGMPTGINVVLGAANSASPNRIVLSGDNTTGEGQLSLSSDGRYLSLAGYDGAVGNTSTVYQANDKVVVRIAYNSAADFSTRIPVGTMNRTVRSAVTSNGDRHFITGSSVSPASGNSTRFLPFATPANAGSTAFNGAVRSLKIFESQVYCANGGIVSSLIPNPSAGNYATRVDFPGMNVPGHNYQSFALLDADAAASYAGTGYDVLYCADQALGLVKFYWNGTTWVLAGTYNPTSATGNTAGLQDITAKLNASGNPEIYAVKGAASNNNIILLTDASGYAGSLTTTPPAAATVASAGANYMFRGIAFSPSQMVIALPVSLHSFNGQLISNDAVITWVTVTEINSKEFIIERSDDGIRYHAIGSVAASNRSTGATYTYTDRNIGEGIFYYRLRSLDKDGKTSLSKIVLIKNYKAVTSLTALFPNPVSETLTMSYPALKKQAVLVVADMSGRQLMKHEIAQGSRQISIDVSWLKKGQYSVVIETNDSKMAAKFTK